MSEVKPKIILTGGHLSPALAVYEVLKKKAECVIAGRKYTFENDKTISLEYILFSEEGVKFYDVKAGRLQRKITKKTLASILRTPSSITRSINIIKKEKPDVVLTFGGYVGLPISIAAKLSGIPVVLHEQTHNAGLTSRFIGKFASKVCISFPTSQKYFNPAKTILTGNPVRKEIFIKKNIPENLKNEEVILVMGGSSGSHNINEYIELLLPKLLEKFIVVHQTGDAQEFKDYERLERLKKSLPHNLQKKYIIKKFIMPDEIGTLYGAADLVISRSGSNTITELLALRKKALLIPLSHGQKTEQLENAKYYSESGLGEYVQEKDINLDALFEKILLVSKKNIATLKIIEGELNPSEKIARIVLDIAYDKKNSSKNF